MTRAIKATEYVDLIESLEAHINGLEGKLADCQELLKHAEAGMSKASTFMALARTFADEHRKHPWASSTVYETGQDLIRAIRELE